MRRNGKKHEFDQTGKVQLKVDSTVILIEDFGKTNGVVTHNAIAEVSYNNEDSNNLSCSIFLQYKEDASMERV